MLNLLQRRKLTPNGPAAGETTENENKKMLIYKMRAHKEQNTYNCPL
jgi:hypothetical protein